MSGGGPRPRYRVAFLTCDALSGGHPDDLLALPGLRSRGVEVEFVPWREPADWTDFDAAVIRTTWDYQHHTESFFALLESIEASGVPLWNPSAVARWNADKRYLEELQDRGVPTVPSVSARLESADHLRALVDEVGGDAVVKPRVGASGEDTWRLGKIADPPRFRGAAEVLHGREILVQPFFGSILEVGEYSATFVEGRVTHLFRKRPRAGEFRSQEEHGGRVEGIDHPEFRRWAEAVSRSVEETHGLLYHRVDGLLDDRGSWRLGELEALEPKLYLGFGQGSADRFAGALTARLAGGRGNALS